MTAAEAKSWMQACGERIDALREMVDFNLRR